MSSDAQNIYDLLERRVTAAAEKQFLFSEPDGRVFTYAKFKAAIDRAAAMLSFHGIGKG
jgi:acyl-coenzyme A synthetase/AMP-(fatty) acid ligase